MHQQHAADALFALFGRVDDAGAARQRARIDAAEGDGADEGVVHDLEAEQRQRRVVLRLAGHFFAVVRVDALDRRHVERRRQEIDDRVEQRLHALVLEGRAAENGKESAGDDGLADEALEGRFVRLLAFEEGGHGGVVEFDGGLDQHLAILLGVVEQVGRNVDVFIVGAERLVFPDHALHADQIDDALEGVFRADRQLDRNRLGAEAGLDVVHALEEVGADLVHLVGEDDARHAVLVALTPDGFGLRLDALVAVEHDDGAVEDAQRALDFDGEVNVAGGVDDVQALAVPECGRRGRRNGDAALLLLLHPVHRRGTFVHFADFMALAGIIENPLSRRRLAGINVSHDAEVAVVLNGMETRHIDLLPE